VKLGVLRKGEESRMQATEMGFKEVPRDVSDGTG
jgi:hypothetical protein